MKIKHSFDPPLKDMAMFHRKVVDGERNELIMSKIGETDFNK